MQTNDNDSLNTFEGLTVSAWIKPDTITGHHSMLSKWGKENANFEWDFYIQDGKLSLMLNAEDSECGGTETFAFVESRLIAAKKWTHVTATYDGSKIRFYVNGTVYSASSQSKMPIAELCDTAEKMRLGVSGYYDNDYIGYTDEVKISNYAKSNKEVCEQEMGYKWQIAASKCKPVDFDKDGYTVVQGDCDDLNPQKYPGNGCSAVNGGNLRGQNSTDESGDGRYGFEDKNFDFENRNVKSNDILSQQIVFAGTTSESSVNSPSLNFQPSKSESSMASQSSMTATTTYSLYYYFQDHLGDTAVVTDETGNIIEAMDYLPFGGVNIDQRYSSDYDADYTFTGKEKDAEEGLFYFGARYYNDVTGKFTSIDPALMEIGHLMNILADPQQFNSYSYVGNNPLAFIDANGKVPDPTDVVVVACGLAAPLCWGAKEAAETLIIVGGYYLIEKFLSDSTDTINDQSQEKENKKTLSDEEKEVIETEIKGLEKGIKSQEKRIKEHEEKLKDPEKALDDPVKKEEFKNNPQYREGVKEYWRKEIKDAQEQIIKNQNKINELESKLESN
ncbi:hypothetical protein HYV57_01650 [Candidatus Peregrinibacteria bacterium]|nr:hypothetical protein [Candidatus Peregrinibacteria bacterium]